MLKKINVFNSSYVVSLILSIYPISFLFMNNIEVLKFSQCLIPLFIIILFSSIIYLLFSFFFKFKSQYTNEVIVPSVVILFFLYNYIHVFLNSQQNFIANIGRNRFLIPMFVIILPIFIIKVKNSSVKVKKTLLVFLFILNILPFYKILNFSSRNLNSLSKPKVINSALNSNKKDPDIYFIILDMYPSNFVLKKYFNYNNEKFTNKLDSLGFNIFHNSKSNYSRTLLSLTSTLNMEYLQNEDDSVSKELTLDYLYMKLQNGKVQTFFKNRGYNFYWFEGGYLPEKSQYSENEFFISVNSNFFSRRETADNDFLLHFINASIISIVSEEIKIISVELFRKRFNSILYNLPIIANKNDQKFVFAHIMAPHPPFVFGEDGEKIYYDENSMNRKAAFLSQLKYVNKQMLQVLDLLVNNNNGRDKIIILQGDHGTREITPNNIYSFNQDWAEEAFGNLSAIYFSNKMKNNNIKYFSSVNTFRYILKTQFNEKLNLLDDRKYYTDFTFPLKLHFIL